MKKTINKVILLALVIFITSLVACQTIAQDAYYKLEFIDADGQVLETQNILHNASPIRPSEDPTKEGFIFINWFTSLEGDILFDFTNPLEVHTKVYAQWRLEIGTQLSYQYSIHSDFDLDLFKIGSNSKVLTDDISVQVEDETVFLPKEVLNTYDIGSYTLEFMVDNEVIKVDLTIFDGIKPYVVNTHALKYEHGFDVVLRIEMFDQTFLSIAHNQMTTEDYVYLKNLLTIRSTYLSKNFNEATTAIMVMSYHLGTQYSSIYITIRA